MPITKEDFIKLSPSEREKELGKMRVRKEFQTLHPEDRQIINDLLKAKKEEPMSQTEAAIRGAAQGLTFGFADELAANLTAAGKSFISGKDFKPLLEEAITAQRARDRLAESEFPKTFVGSEVGGAVATTLVPFGAGLTIARVGKLAQAGKAVKLGKLQETIALGKKFSVKTPEAIAEAAKIAKETPSVLSKIVGKTFGITKEQIGKGTVRGLLGITKGAAGGAAITLGKAEEKTLEKALEGATIGGAVSTAANIVFPLARKAITFVGEKPGQVVRAVTPFSVNAELAATGVQKARDAIVDSGAKITQGMRLEKIAGALKAGGTIFGNVLVESFAKQGGAGLAAAHLMLLQNPAYGEFLDRIESTRTGLKVPKKGKK